MTDLTTFLAGTSLPELLESSGLEDPVAFITRFESAFLTAIGFPGSMGMTDTTFHQWPETALNADTATLADATLSAAATTINVTTGQGARFRNGDVVQFDGSRELILITNVSTDALTVTRAYRSTTGETQVLGDVLQVINNPNTENGNAKTARPTGLSRTNNYTELFDDTASVTSAMQKSKQIGNISNRMDHEVMQVKRDLIRRIARTVLNGKRQASNPEGTLSVARAMDGIIQLILGGGDSVVVDAGGAAMTEDLLNQALEESWTRGGNPTLLAASTKQKRAISRLMEGRVRFQGEDSVLGVVVERFVSDFGVIDVMEPDKFMPKDACIIVDRSKIKLAKLGSEGDPFIVEDLAKTSHADDKMVSVELTLEAKNTGDGGHALIHNLNAA